MRTGSRNNRGRHKQKGYGNILFVGIFTLVVDLLLAIVAGAMIGGTVGVIYYQTVFLPLATFVAAFFTLMRCRKMLLCMCLPMLVHLLFYWIMVGLSPSVILWMSLYMFSGFIGLAMSYIVVTHKE